MMNFFNHPGAYVEYHGRRIPCETNQDVRACIDLIWLEMDEPAHRRIWVLPVHDAGGAILGRIFENGFKPVTAPAAPP